MKNDLRDSWPPMPRPIPGPPKAPPPPAIPKTKTVVKFVWVCEHCDIHYHTSYEFEHYHCNKCKGFCELLSKRKG